MKTTLLTCLFVIFTHLMFGQVEPTNNDQKLRDSSVEKAPDRAIQKTYKRSPLIKISEYDKFIKQYRIETNYATIQNSITSDLSIKFESIDSSIFMIVSGTGKGTGVLNKGDAIIFLFTNDTTCTAYSKGPQGYPGTHTGEGYRHEYTITTSAINLLKTKPVKSIREYKSNDYSDTNIKEPAARKLSDLAGAFLDEYNSKEGMFGKQ